jgi:methionyl aminopeptidase
VFHRKNNIILKSAEDISAIKESCMIVAGALTEVAKALKPGVTGLEIDKIAEEYILDMKAKPGFKGYGGFPGTLCVSVNEQVVHGIPTDRPFRETDIISVDCGSILNGYYGDSAFTFAMPEVNEDAMKLLNATNESLYLGIAQAKKGNRIGDIGYAVQSYTESLGYSVVRELVGHGIGRNLHEAPEVPNYGKRGRGVKIETGLVIAIEPMINMGRKEVVQSEDGWSIVTRDGKLSAHYEHTIAVTEEGPVKLSSHEGVLEAVKNNINLANISLKK